VTEIRETRYAKTPDGVSIAYQVVGDGPVDIVYSSGIWSNLELMWEHPPWARMLRRLASFSRLIVFDMRGVGLSDAGARRPSSSAGRHRRRDGRSPRRRRPRLRRRRALDGHAVRGRSERTHALILYAPVAKTISTSAGRAEQQAFFERFVPRSAGATSAQAPSVVGDKPSRWWARYDAWSQPERYEELAGSSRTSTSAVLPRSTSRPRLHRAGDQIVRAPGAIRGRTSTARYVSSGDDRCRSSATRQARGRDRSS
jgi:pimeloyl-ACP methyl ester carboxylesterase